MKRTIRAYFKSENDAESAHAEMHKLGINQVFIDKMEDDPTGHVPFLLPNSGSSSINQAAVPFFGFNLKLEEKDSARNYIMECEVDDQNVNNVVQMIKTNDGLVDNSLS